jgi:hypothetical protein
MGIKKGLPQRSKNKADTNSKTMQAMQTWLFHPNKESIAMRVPNPSVISSAQCLPSGEIFQFMLSSSSSWSWSPSPSTTDICSDHALSFVLSDDPPAGISSSCVSHEIEASNSP